MLARAQHRQAHKSAASRPAGRISRPTVPLGRQWAQRQASAVAWRRAISTDSGAQKPISEEVNVFVDTSGLRSSKNQVTIDPTKKKPANELTKHLIDTIKARGPISLATWMNYCLSHPQYGYYMTKEAIGAKGDFVTSPEISQMFGELIGIWCVALWTEMKRPKTIRVVELGPGKGTLTADIVKIGKRFREFGKSFSLHLVETSPKLRNEQAKALGVAYPEPTYVDLKSATERRTSPLIITDYSGGGARATLPSEAADAANKRDSAQKSDGAQSDLAPTVSTKTDEGVEVSWHHLLEDVPAGPTIIIAHEFFDALPAHQFHFSKQKGWCERLVDLDPSDSPEWFRLVVSPGPTYASAQFLRGKTVAVPDSEPSEGDCIEVSPGSMAVAQLIGSRINQHGGGALIIDYGHNRAIANSIRGIRSHKFVDFLEAPGEVDLSVDVDFAALRRAAEKTVRAGQVQQNHNLNFLGPVTQEDFLKNLGVDVRMARLLRLCNTEDEAQNLIFSYKRLVESNEMGSIYKVLGITNLKQESTLITPDPKAPSPHKFESGFV